MKWHNFKFQYITGVFLLLFPFLVNAQSRYDKHVRQYKKAWERLIPTYSKIQFAGDIGLLSLGTGWNYGKRNQWETDILLGFIPKYSSKDFKMTITLKQNYLPWNIELGKGFSAEPLACGIYFNTVLNDDFWTREPDRYPEGYYGFSTRIRTHIFLGQRLTYDIKYNKRMTARAITFFYEISTCDLYLVSAVGNSYLRPKDYLRLSFGLKLQLL